MLKFNEVKKYFLSTIACLFMLFAAQAMHAQIGSGQVTFGVSGTSVYNGGSNNSGTLYNLNAVTVAINLQGVGYNGGSASFACYVTPQGGNTSEFFYGTVQQSGLTTTSWQPTSQTTYVFYCDVSYSGIGSTSTPTITMTVE